MVLCTMYCVIYTTERKGKEPRREFISSPKRDIQPPIPPMLFPNAIGLSSYMCETPKPK